MPAPTSPGRLATIDALRGVAAICVVLFHVGPDSSVRMPGGFLAVDIFFALSGFVIANAYAERVEAGLGFATFMRLRVARLWPMLVLGAVLSILLHGGHAGLLFVLPNPKSPDMLFPGNPPYWSLLLEMVAYAAFALLWIRLGRRALLALIGACAAILALASFGATGFESFGAGWSTMIQGLARLGFAFGTGLAIWSIQRRWPVRRRTTAAAWLIPVAFVLIAALTPRTNGAALAVCVLAIPVLVWCATCFEVTAPRLAAALGDLSYPLYCVHAPLIASAAVFGWTVPMVVTLPIIALLLDRGVDARARRALKRLLIIRPAARDAATAWTRPGIGT